MSIAQRPTSVYFGSLVHTTRDCELSGPEVICWTRENGCLNIRANIEKFSSISHSFFPKQFNSFVALAQTDVFANDYMGVLIGFSRLCFRLYSQRDAYGRERIFCQKFYIKVFSLQKFQHKASRRKTGFDVSE